VALGIELVTVITLALWTISTVIGLNGALVREGADRGVFVIIMALAVFGIRAWDRYQGWDKRIDKPTMESLRAAEHRFYSVTGGRPRTIRRDHVLRPNQRDPSRRNWSGPEMWLPQVRDEFRHLVPVMGGSGPGRCRC
jgi:hypothetical protein